MIQPFTRLTLFGILSLLSVQVLAFELKAFDERYSVYRGESRVGEARFSLRHENALWVWNMTTRPKGLYRFLTSKKPFERTVMAPINDLKDWRISLEETGSYPDKPAKKVSWFDYDSGTIYHRRKSKHKSFPFEQPVFNYHSIHLLYTDMLEQDIGRQEINLFHAGKLRKANLTLKRGVTLKGADKNFTVDQLIVASEGSKRTITYYYRGDTLAPLKIEHREPDQDVSVMWRIDE
jgi:hypothetical protein